MEHRSEDNPLVGNVEVQAGGKAVFAEKIDAVHIHNEPAVQITPLDPFATVPPKPPNYIDRPEVLEPIIEDLLSTSSSVGLTALEGMGGVGKTLVALGLCYDPRIRHAFPDGIVWLTIGREANIPLERRIEHVARALNSDFREYTEATYRSLLNSKAVLVVLDDVWTLDAIEPFLLNSGQSRVLYTTRDKSLSAPLGGNNHEISIIDEKQARRFLARWSGREAKAPPEPFATQILSECGGLVLGLAMIGPTLRGQPDSEWARVLSDLKKARLKNIARPVGSRAYNTLHGCIALSVEALDPVAKSRYLQLAALLEDMPAPEKLLQCLWGGDNDEVHRTARLFVDRSLATRDADDDIRLHDFQLDYIRGEHPDIIALALEHSALMRSIHVIRSNPEQFTSQMTGRLLAHDSQPGVKAFLNELDRNALRPRLRPLWPTLEAAGGAVLRVLEGHRDGVLAVALSGDGHRAVSGSNDNTLRVWDLEDNQPPRILEGHTSDVLAVALSSDGRRALSGSNDNTLRVWDLEGSQPPRILEGHADRVNAVALSADGSFAVSASDDRTLRLWDLEGNQPPRILEGHTKGVLAVALSSDGRRAVSGSDDNTLRVWDLEGSQPPRILEGHADRVNAVALSSDGRRAVSGSDDNTMRLWDLESNHLPRILEGHTNAVEAVALSADGQRAVSGSLDDTLRVWDLEGNHPPRILEGHTNTVFAVALSGDGQRAVSGSDDNTLRVWDLEGNQPPRILEGHADRVNAIALSSDGRFAVSGSHDRTLRLWDLEGNHPPRILEGHTSEVFAVALSGDGRRAVSGSNDNTMRVWDLEGNQPPRILEGHTGAVFSVALSVDGQCAVSGSDDNTMRVWDLEGNQPPRILEGHTDAIRAVALSADTRLAISGSYDNTLRIWDLEGNQPPRILEGHADRVYAVALTGDGRRGVSGSDDNTLRVWDLEGNRSLGVLEGHTSRVSSVALSGDGRRAVSGSADRSLRVWNMIDGRTVSSFTCDAPVTSCRWAGSNIVAGDRNGRVHLFTWEE